VRLAATGGAAPYAWAVRAPAGLVADASGAIGGRLERPGSFPLSLMVTDRDGRMAEGVVVLHVEPPLLRLRSHSLPNATIGVPYRAELACEGGIEPLRWTAEPPAGLVVEDGVLFGTPLGPSEALAVDVGVRDAARQRATASYAVVVRPASAAGDESEWTPERLADEQHAYAVIRHEAGVDVAATRARIALLRARVARRPLARDQFAALILVAGLAGALLSLFLGAFAVMPPAAALAYAIGPAVLRRARLDELERLEPLLGCGRRDCPRCVSRRPSRGPAG
jgi:hypothetical protein